MTKLSPNARAALVAERRAQILQAAAKVFARRGYERATIAEVAQAAGLAEGSIYNYFKSKGDLLVGLPRQVVEMPIAALGQFADTGSPEEALALMARTMMGAIKRNAHIFRILLTSVPHMSKKVRRQYFDQVVLYATGILGAYFKEQIRRGIFRQDLDADILALGFVGMFFPTILLSQVMQIDLAQTADEEQVITNCVEVFLTGALANPRFSRRPREKR